MTRPPSEDIERLHGEATAPRGEDTDEERVTFCQRRFEEDVSASWSQVSEYIRTLESEVKQAQRRMHEAGHKSAAAMLNDVRRMMGDADE